MEPLVIIMTLADLLLMTVGAVGVHVMLKRTERRERHAAEPTQHARATDAAH